MGTTGFGLPKSRLPAASIMGTARLHFAPWGLDWWPRVGQPAHAGCIHSRGLWNRVRLRSPGILLHSRRYCLEHCFAEALAHALQGLGTSQPRRLAAHRIPLGLLLLSRQQLTAEQLQSALRWQRREGRGRIGEWLQTLGFVSEQQITAALARQWSCPVLHNPSSFSPASRVPQLPFTLLGNFAMVPVNYIESTATLVIAFADELDYSVLYAIEQMTGCHTEPCLAVPSFVRAQLQALTPRRRNNEIFLESGMDASELSRIILAYCARLWPSEVRIARCAPYFWIRLLRDSRPRFDLVLGSPPSSTAMDPLAPERLTSA